MSILIISTSLKPTSHSRKLALKAKADLEAKGIATDWLDLQDSPLPFCDAGGAYGDPALPEIKQKIADATGIIFAAPIYTFDISAAGKNLIEMTGKDCWTDKVVGFLCAAGGQGSYMAVMQIANSLMLDFRTFIVPRFVYATGESFSETQITDDAVGQRTEELALEVNRVATALTVVS